MSLTVCTAKPYIFEIDRAVAPSSNFFKFSTFISIVKATCFLFLDSDSKEDKSHESLIALMIKHMNRNKIFLNNKHVKKNNNDHIEDWRLKLKHFCTYAASLSFLMPETTDWRTVYVICNVDVVFLAM